MKFLKKEKGFTLIELLVVVAIIGVLASIVISSLGDARDKSADVQVFSRVRELQKSLEIFNIDNNRYPYTRAGDNLLYASNCAGFPPAYTNAWDYMVSDMGDYLPDFLAEEGDEWPHCLYYMKEHPLCSGEVDPEYTIIISFKDTAVENWDEFNNDPNRYCIFPL